MDTTMATKDILFRVNELRAREGRSTISAWKGKKEALLAMLEELQAKFLPKTRKNGALASYCRDHGLNAKTMRQRLRDAGKERNLDCLLEMLGSK